MNKSSAPRKAEIEQPKISMIRPKMEVGISIYNRTPTDEDLAYLKESFTVKGCKCDACGVSLTDEMINHHYESGLWFNVCLMCYCASNLDKIPHYKRGDVVWFPYMSQARLNAVVRGLWAGGNLQKTNSKDLAFKEMMESLDDISGSLGLRKASTDNFFQFSDVNTVSSTLFILKKEEYDRRFTLLNDFRWLPIQEIFEDEMAYWGPEDYSGIHPDKISGNITKFMSQYAPEFSIKK